MNKKEFTGNEYVIGYSTVPFHRGPPSIFIFLSVYTYATNRGCISRYDAAPPAFEKCVSSHSASTAGAHTRLCKHTRTLPSSANTLASPKLCQHIALSADSFVSFSLPRISLCSHRTCSLKGSANAIASSHQALPTYSQPYYLKLLPLEQQLVATDRG